MVEACAQEQYEEAEDYAQQVYMHHPSEVKRWLAGERLRLLKERIIASDGSFYNSHDGFKSGVSPVARGLLYPLIDELYTPAIYHPRTTHPKQDAFSRSIRELKDGKDPLLCAEMGYLLAHFITDQTDLRRKADIILRSLLVQTG